jgi:hypothetical protein
MRLPSMPASVGPLEPGLAASLPTVCAASVPRAVERLVPPASARSAAVRRVVSSSESPYALRGQVAVLSGMGQSGGVWLSARPRPPRAVPGAPWWWCGRLS